MLPKSKTILVPQINIGQFCFIILVSIMFSNNISSSDLMYSTSHSGYDTQIWIYSYEHGSTFFPLLIFPNVLFLTTIAKKFFAKLHKL